MMSLVIRQIRVKRGIETDPGGMSGRSLKSLCIEWSGASNTHVGRLDLGTKGKVALSTRRSLQHGKMQCLIVWKVDQTTIIDKNKPGRCPNVMIFVMTLMWCGHNLLRRKKAHRNIRDVDSMKAEHNWFAFCVGKGPIDKTRANDV